MTEKRNPIGKNKRPHGAWCAVCAKPKTYRKTQLLKEKIAAAK